MLNSKNKTPKLDDLNATIAQARKSLSDWQNQKTEALIQLDSLSYDIGLLEDEKNRELETNDVLRNEIETNSRIYQAHVEALMDQIQTLRMEKEETQRQLVDMRIRAETLEREGEEYRVAEVRAEATQRLRVAEARSEVEMQMADETQKLRSQISDLSVCLHAIQAEKNETEKRAGILEKELNGIRGHMLNALRTTADNPQTTAATPASAVVSAGASKKQPVISSEASTVMRDHKGEVETVEEFLKRFGY